MAEQPFDVGDLIRISVAVTDVNGSAVDPSKLHFMYADPEGLPAAASKGGKSNPYVYGTDGEIVKDSTGNYHIDFAVNKGGIWNYRWLALTAASTAAGADEDKFFVSSSIFS